MGRRLPIVCISFAFLMSFSLGSNARAEIWLWDGTFGLEFDGLPPIEQPVSGVATVNGSAGGGHLTTLAIGNLLELSGTTTRSGTTVDPVFFIEPQSIGVSASLPPGTLRPISGGGPLTQGALPMPGGVRICLLAPCTTPSFTLPLTSGGLGAGVGGILTIQQATRRFSVFGAPWTVGTASVQVQELTSAQQNLTTTTVVRQGFAFGPSSLPSSTVATNGILRLVTPIAIRSDIFTPNATTAAFGTLTIRFVPEPSGFVLPLATGVLALAGLGRLKRRR